MDGYVITYAPFDSGCRVKLNHILFGRLVYRSYRGKKYTYYVQGMLDKTPFMRIMASKIFVTDLNHVDIEKLRILADVDIQEAKRDITMESLRTGEEHWKNISEEKGLDFYVKKIRKKNE